MGKVTVSETVSRSVTVDNNVANNIQSATTRCFQFLEEGRFEEAHVVIEQILNVAPNNTDVHVANFLYHFRLTKLADVANKFQNVAEYKNSTFFNRIMNNSPTDLVNELNSWIITAEERLNKEIQSLFVIEKSYARKSLISSISFVVVVVYVLGLHRFEVFLALLVLALPFFIGYYSFRYAGCRRKKQQLESAYFSCVSSVVNMSNPSCRTRSRTR